MGCTAKLSYALSHYGGGFVDEPLTMSGENWGRTRSVHATEEIEMATIIPFNSARQPRRRAGAGKGEVGRGESETRGQILLFTGVRYGPALPDASGSPKSGRRARRG